MAQAAPTVDVLWTAFRALPPDMRDQFMEKVVADAALRQELEDALDRALARERANEPARPLDDVLAELAER